MKKRLIYAVRTIIATILLLSGMGALIVGALLIMQEDCFIGERTLEEYCSPSLVWSVEGFGVLLLGLAIVFIANVCFTKYEHTSA